MRAAPPPYPTPKETRDTATPSSTVYAAPIPQASKIHLEGESSSRPYRKILRRRFHPGENPPGENPQTTTRRQPGIGEEAVDGASEGWRYQAPISSKIRLTLGHWRSQEAFFVTAEYNT